MISPSVCEDRGCFIIRHILSDSAGVSMIGCISIHFDVIVEIRGISERLRHILVGVLVPDMANIVKKLPLRLQLCPIVRSPLSAYFSLLASFFYI